MQISHFESFPNLMAYLLPCFIISYIAFLIAIQSDHCWSNCVAWRSCCALSSSRWAYAYRGGFRMSPLSCHWTFGSLRILVKYAGIEPYSPFLTSQPCYSCWIERRLVYQRREAYNLICTSQSSKNFRSLYSRLCLSTQPFDFVLSWRRVINHNLHLRDSN